jgi:hypothetical protein
MTSLPFVNEANAAIMAENHDRTKDLYGKDMLKYWTLSKKVGKRPLVIGRKTLKNCGLVT